MSLRHPLHLLEVLELHNQVKHIQNLIFIFFFQITSPDFGQ